MKINLDNLSRLIQIKYKEFIEEVKKLLKQYEKKDSKNFNLVAEKIKDTKGNWDTTLDIISGDSIESVDITQLLAYEYCLASEKITRWKS